MPKPTKGPRLGGSPSHERIILANLATQLFDHGRITTTVTRAKRVQPLAEHLITKARRGGLHEIRTVGKTITDSRVLDHLFREIGPSLTDRDGGYTRITKIGARKGDGAPMAIIEIITEEVAPKKPAKKTAKPVAKAKAVDVDEDIEEVEDEDLDDDEAADELEDEVEDEQSEIEPDDDDAEDDK